MSSSFADCGIIIVNHKLAQETIDCVESCLKAGASLSQIILVDNGSNDGSHILFRERYPDQLNLVVIQEVRGYAFGLNQGIKKAVELGFDWLLFMSNDTVVDKDFIIELKKATLHSPHKVFGPKILYYDDPERIWFLGSYQVAGTLLTHDPYRNKKEKIVGDPYLAVDFLNGCCFLIHKQVYFKTGFLDTSYFMYAEEVDYLIRVRSAGYQMVAVPSAKMWHKVSAFMNKDKPLTRMLRIRNQIWVYRKYSSRIHTPFIFIFTIGRSLVISFEDILQRRFNLLAPLVNGFVKGWFGKLPPAVS